MRSSMSRTFSLLLLGMGMVGLPCVLGGCGSDVSDTTGGTFTGSTGTAGSGGTGGDGGMGGAGFDLSRLTVDVSYEGSLGKVMENSDAKQQSLRAVLGIKI